MYHVTCPRCRRGSAHSDEDADRISCPFCLATFDPYLPLPVEASKVSVVDSSDAPLGGVGEVIDLEPESVDLATDSDAEFDADFEAGL